MLSLRPGIDRDRTGETSPTTMIAEFDGLSQEAIDIERRTGQDDFLDHDQDSNFEGYIQQESQQTCRTPHQFSSSVLARSGDSPVARSQGETFEFSYVRWPHLSASGNCRKKFAYLRIRPSHIPDASQESRYRSLLPVYQATWHSLLLSSFSSTLIKSDRWGHDAEVTRHCIGSTVLVCLGYPVLLPGHSRSAMHCSSYRPQSPPPRTPSHRPSTFREPRS